MSGYLIKVNCTSNGAVKTGRCRIQDAATESEALASAQAIMTDMWVAKGMDPQNITTSVLEVP